MQKLRNFVRIVEIWTTWGTAFRRGKRKCGTWKKRI